MSKYSLPEFNHKNKLNVGQFSSDEYSGVETEFAGKTQYEILDTFENEGLITSQMGGGVELIFVWYNY